MKVPVSRLWLLDADVVIDLLSMGIFDLLTARFTVHVSSIVAGEVKFFRKSGQKVPVDFRSVYVDSGKVAVLDADDAEVRGVLEAIPAIRASLLHSGELESLAILCREEDLTFCTCDGAAIQALPFLDLAERAVSVEKLLRSCGLTPGKLEEKHRDRHLKDNLATGSRERLQGFKA